MTFSIRKIECQCGEAWQTKEGWDAQGLFEDIQRDGRWLIKLHRLPPEKCEEVDDDKDAHEHARRT